MKFFHVAVAAAYQPAANVSLATVSPPSTLEIASSIRSIQSKKMLSEYVHIDALIDGSINHKDLEKIGMDSISMADIDINKMNLPDNIVNMVNASGTFDEASLDKARRILNGMIEQAQVDLDKKEVECKEFKEQNRKTYSQVRTDLARLGAQIGNLDRMKVEAIKTSDEADVNIQDLEQQRDDETGEYQDIRKVDDALMAVRKNDLAVAEFIMHITKCGAKALVQTNEILECPGDDTDPHKPVTPIVSHNVSMLYMFRNTTLQRKVEEFKSADAKAMVQMMMLNALDQTRQLHSLASLAQRGLRHHKSGRLVQNPNVTRMANKCTLGKPNCGLLHDNMSLMWGEMKDAVDELQEKMDRDEGEFNKFLSNINEQLKVLVSIKATAGTELAEATAARAADSDEQGRKQDEAKFLEHQFREVYGECRATIHEILFTNLCGVKKVRGDVMKHSTKVKPEDIIDCEVSDWVPGRCSKKCDNKMKGGKQTLKRVVVQKGSDLGTKCPTLKYRKKCNAFKCPVSCKMGKWSRWGKCTKECEGGVQGRTRSIERKPKNGGDACDVTQESRPCNTGSCDRDCKLSRWTRYSGCSQACGGGISERFRGIKRAKRGNGACPKRLHKLRYRRKKCNKRKCIGDEVCVAYQDLIIAVDGSGSVRESGFKTIKKFVKKLVKRLKSRAYQRNAMRVGIIQFGNGKILADGTISKAKVISPLTGNMKKIKTRVKKMKWKRGFTNMAQAFTMAKSVFLNGGRKRAQSTMIVISDAKPSFHHQTTAAVKNLRRGGVNVIMAPIMNFPAKKEIAVMKNWASNPWKYNLVFIPGLKKLGRELGLHTTRTLIQSCPRAKSAKREKLLRGRRGYQLLRRRSFCKGKSIPVGRVGRISKCAAAARKLKAKHFMMGRKNKRGQCIVVWSKNKCPEGYKGSVFDYYRLAKFNRKKLLK